MQTWQTRGTGMIAAGGWTGLVKPLAPFVLFFILICTPGITNIASVNFSVAIFPFIVFGYALAARDGLALMVPAAQRLAVLLLAFLLLICGWSLLTALGVDSFVRVFRPIYGHASGLALIIAILALSRTPASGRRTQNICAFIIALTMAATYLIGPRTYGDRYPGFFKHPNQLGVVAAMATVYFCCLVLTSSGKRSIWAAAGLLLSVYALFLTGSKTNLLSTTGLCLTAVPLLAFQVRDPRRAVAELYRNFLAAGAAIFAGVTILPLVSARAYTVLDTILSGDEEVNQYGSVVARAGLWQEAWEMGLAHPLTGVGAGQLMSDGTEHAHNAFMDALRTTGFPGLIITIAYVVAVLWYVAGAYRAAAVLKTRVDSPLSQDWARGPFVGSLLALISYFISNQMSDSFGPSTIPFFYMFLAFTFFYMSVFPSHAGELSGRQAEPIT